MIQHDRRDVEDGGSFLLGMARARIFSGVVVAHGHGLMLLLRSRARQVLSRGLSWGERYTKNWYVWREDKTDSYFAKRRDSRGRRRKLMESENTRNSRWRCNVSTI